MLPGMSSGLLAGGPGGIDAYTVLLLHMDGANGGTTFTDSSLKNKSININSTVTTVTTDKKFGTASCSFGAAASYLNILNSSGGDPDFAFGTGDWTIDFCINRSGAGGVIYDGRQSANGNFPTINMTSGVINYIVGAAGTSVISTTTTLSTGAWYHVAVARASGTTRMFLNGVQEGGNYTDSTNYITGNNRPVIGNNYAAANRILALIDEFRVSKGIARWTANFTPPTGPYTL